MVITRGRATRLRRRASTTDTHSTRFWPYAHSTRRCAAGRGAPDTSGRSSDSQARTTDGAPTGRRFPAVQAIPGRPVLMTAVVPAYRCGTVPDSHRVPSHDSPVDACAARYRDSANTPPRQTSCAGQCTGHDLIAESHVNVWGDVPGVIPVRALNCLVLVEVAAHETSQLALEHFQVGVDAAGDGSGVRSTPLRPRHLRRFVSVLHVSALDEDRWSRGQVESGQISPPV